MNEDDRYPDEATDRPATEESPVVGPDSEPSGRSDRAAARQQVIEAMARSMEVYGGKRSYGRLYGICYFADGPLSLDRLVEESGYAKSTVSTAMNALERFHLVQRRSLPGEGKKAFFEAEEDLWYVFEQVLDEQVRREMQLVRRALEAAEGALEESEAGRAKEDLRKIREFQEVVVRMESIVDVLTEDGLETLASTADPGDRS